jgi:transcriptional regulator with GAF, ATPase, and Fis domain
MSNNGLNTLEIKGADGNAISLRVLRELSDAISGALEAVDTFQPPDVKKGICFYDEVRRFEVDLIRRALKISLGSQTRAARLLRLKTSTLNSKIKYYNIEWRNGVSAMESESTGNNTTASEI